MDCTTAVTSRSSLSSGLERLRQAVEVSPEMTRDPMVFGVFTFGELEHRTLFSATVLGERAARVVTATRWYVVEARNVALHELLRFVEPVMRFGVGAQHRREQPLRV